MITPYLSQQPVDDFGLNFPSVKYSATLAITTDTTLTIPGKAQRYKAIMTCETGGYVWIALNATAAAPGGSSFAATTSELITAGQRLCREVKAGDVLHFFSGTATTDMSVVLFALGTNN